MKIGELARRTGVSTRSLRYYEQRGLLTARRDHNGYRRYSTDAVDLVLNLRRLLKSGLSVADVHRFGSCVASPDLDSTPCVPALAVYEQRLRTLDEQIATLTHLRHNLAAHTEHLRARIEAE
ncbi:MerR family transcriptional regulator [Allosaccharopolyspora coralli]|uniref:MerR family transcriptional regulator n=1 Tax=Allosaccharopolyspora coralli TaxID=2665642 RepID=A0A5Q3QCV7_9PSEU|nr:MerR family transcriptional regulator [Allosaccharopolyspora coralli]